MKTIRFVLGASIAAALAGSVATPALGATALPADAAGDEAARITQTVDNRAFSVVPHTHVNVVERLSPRATLPDSFTMNHLQLVLKPSAARQAALTTLIASQHDPKSSGFRQWLTPAQFGNRYGVADSDIATVTAWLTAQGFTVNQVYPNKAQIDFSGTVGAVKAAFHTGIGVYQLGKSQESHLANTGDISIPTALNAVVAGVMGLSDFRPRPFAAPLKTATWNAGKNAFVADASKAAAPTQPVLTNATSRNASSAAKGLAITFPVKGLNAQNAIRGLVPNDMATMYGIRTLRNNGVTGKGITIALVEDNSMVPADWSNFASVFNLTRYGGTFSQINPAPASGATNCYDPNAVIGAGQDFIETVLDAEWSTAIAPAANIVVASCADYYYDDGNPVLASANFFGGAFIAATNVVNAASGRPDIISASYGYGEYFTDSASKAAIDLLWAQADAEGISVFVSSGDSGSNPSFNGFEISGANGGGGLDANAFATSPNVTAVGGTDLADILDGTTSQYFASTPSVVGGSALSYVPEIPWNETCGNGLGARFLGYASPLAFCEAAVSYAFNPPATPTALAPYQYTFAESEAGSGGPSSVDRKPVWQRQIYNAASDQSRDLPDVSLFAGSFGDDTLVILCTSAYPCAADFSTPMSLTGGTSLSSPMFAGIQALIDQGLTKNGLSKDQGNAAPTLYALAAGEYGGPSSVNQAGLATCNADNGATGTSGCIFHNVTRGSNSTGCWSQSATTGTVFGSFTTPNCYVYVSGLVAGTATDSSGKVVDEALASYGLTTTDAAPTGYGPANKAFGARPGWSFATGLGSVNATNLLIAWRAFVNAPAIH